MNAASLAAGAIVGLSLGLTGGGGAIFAVPLLVYWIGGDGPRSGAAGHGLLWSAAGPTGFFVDAVDSIDGAPVERPCTRR
jgi:uncharacterized membrane protein YfcA